ncbi:hypothetical protein [Streptomyces sp. CC224B]|uniref:TolB family protein n=1 Tax=Streptomyces sp. CC224B TaxID=3044571 RepID=UPI0032BF75E7
MVAVCAVTAVLPAAASADARGVADDPGTGVERLSVAADGTQGDGASAGASITPDGRHVVFSSSAGNLVPGSFPQGDVAYVRDRSAGQTKRVGTYPPLQPPVISGDGAYLAYATPWMRDVRTFSHQVSTGAIAGVNCSAHSCGQPSLSAEGRYLALAVTFRPPLSGQRVEVQDQDTGTKETVADLGHTSTSRPSISGDGRRVAYQDGRAGDVFVWDRTTGTSSGPLEGPSATASLVQLSDDGGKVVHRSGPDTYVHDVGSGTAQRVPNVRGLAIDPTGRHLLYAPHDTTGPALVLRDLHTGTDRTVSRQPATAGADAVSAGGRHVVFQSAADDIVPDDTNGTSDVFIRHFTDLPER